MQSTCHAIDNRTPNKVSLGRALTSTCLRSTRNFESLRSLRNSIGTYMMKTTTKRKRLSSIANHVLHKCAETVDVSDGSLVGEFETGWKFETGDYSRKLVEFCSTKALSVLSSDIEEKIADGSFSRFTFDMMLAWEKPNPDNEQSRSYTEGVAKEREDKKMPLKVEANEQDDDVSLFYSDLMPLLVDDEASIGEEAFVWLASLVPLPADIVNGKFSFETLTADTANRLYFPGYDVYLKEIDRCIKNLQKQRTPTGVVLADDEFVLHLEGTAQTQRVVRHIGGTSWPGRLTLTNYALYFEASGVINYEDALKIDLSKETDHSVKRASTGPWGAPIFDKALVYESCQLSETVVLEFPEMTSSTRREHWLALIREVILMHQFMAKFKDISPHQSWEMKARTILAIARLHAAREMKRISPPVPTSFLIFSLFHELPKGDIVLEELANTIKQADSSDPCNASSILKNLIISKFTPLVSEDKEDITMKDSPTAKPVNISSLQTSIDQAREGAIEADVARATVEGLKEEGINESFLVLSELLSPLKKMKPQVERILAWEKSLISVLVLCATLIVTYKEWIGKAMALLLAWGVRQISQARRQRIKDRYTEIVVYTGSDQSTVESLVNAQHGFQSVRSVVHSTNISILKIYSLLLSRAPKHTDTVMMAMVGLAVLLAVIPLKFMIMSLTVYVFAMNASKQKKKTDESRTERRLKEWWSSIPAIPVRTVDQTP